MWYWSHAQHPWSQLSQRGDGGAGAGVDAGVGVGAVSNLLILNATTPLYHHAPQLHKHTLQLPRNQKGPNDLHPHRVIQQQAQAPV